MSVGRRQSVPALLVPVDAGLLVLPTAMVSEVCVSGGVQPVPATRPWMLGYFMWRGIPVSALSFDALSGGGQMQVAVRKLVVMYPLRGRPSHDFFAFATRAEPHTAFIDSAVESGPAPAGLSPRYVAGLLSLPQGLGIIPDFDALNGLFYDQPQPAEPA